jgi:lantibiotic modifying enzyme
MADPSQTGWRPLLTGSAADEVRAIIRAVADALRGWSPAAGEIRHPGWAACIASGEAGVALFFAYLALAGLDDTAAATATRFLERAIDRLANEAMNPSLYSGFTGVAWATAHLQAQLFPSAEDRNEPIDEALAGFLSEAPWSGEFDLINGLVGFGVYALERLPAAAGTRLLARVVEALEESSTVLAVGTAWRTRPEWFPLATRAAHPNGYFNLGLAHGMPGVIALLGRACSRRIENVRAEGLLADAVRWLLTQESRESDWEGFPSWVEPGGPAVRSRLAWCYGDLGIAIALLGAARCVTHHAWEERALAIARRAADCALEQSVVRDAGLCHGAAGVGHLFNRLYQATGNGRFADAAVFWLRHALGQRTPGRGVAGYAAFWSQENGQAEWMNEVGFLLGAAGIGLALLAAVTPVEPSWDRLLLADLAPGLSGTSLQRPVVRRIGF